VLEIKCPYCHRDSTVISAAREDRKFCLKEVNGKLTLHEKHSYYYQVQTQLFFVMHSTQIFVHALLRLMRIKKMYTMDGLRRSTNFGMESVCPR